MIFKKKNEIIGTHTWCQGNTFNEMANLYPMIEPEELSLSEVREKVISSGLLDDSIYGLGKKTSDYEITDFRMNWQISHDNRIVADENKNLNERLKALNKLAEDLYKRYTNVNRRNTRDISNIIDKVEDEQFRKAVLVKLIEIEFKENDLYYTGIILKNEKYSDLHKTAQEKLKALEDEETGLQKMKRKKASDPVEADGWLYFFMKEDKLGLYKSLTDGSKMQLLTEIDWDEAKIKEIDTKNNLIYYSAFHYYTYEKYRDIDVTDTTTIEYKITTDGKDRTELSRDTDYGEFYGS